jgi:hypothetical protein
MPRAAKSSTATAACPNRASRRAARARWWTCRTTRPITPAGRELHDNILAIALERDRALMSVLSPEEREALLVLLRRLHDNLPAVEAATAKYLALHYPHAAGRRRKTPSEE